MNISKRLSHDTVSRAAATSPRSRRGGTHAGIILVALCLTLSGAAFAQTGQTPSSEQTTTDSAPPPAATAAAPDAEAATDTPESVQAPSTPNAEATTADAAAPDQATSAANTGAAGDAAAPTQTPTTGPLPRDLSPLGMYMQADNVVKGIIITLLLASVLSWAILLVKWLEIVVAKKQARRTLRFVRDARTLDQARTSTSGQAGPGVALIRAATAEVETSAEAIPHAGGDGLKERAVSRLHRIELTTARRIAAGTGILATISSTAPFIGLFGTVWGIMNAFIGIAESQTSNLAVVAPGIAEALMATAIGLIAAIPATLIYNFLARYISGYRLLLSDISAGVLQLISRDLDFRQLTLTAAEPRASVAKEHIGTAYGVARSR